MGETRTITGELRELLADVNWGEINDHMRLDDRGAIFDGDWLESWHAAAGHACDAIDAVHANLERENASLKAELDRVLGEQEDRDGWVRLPVDADGVPIRIGDVVDSSHYEDGTVTGVQFYEMSNGGIRTLIAVRSDGWDVSTWHTPDEYRHHHAPTVEDVLREMADRCYADEGEPRDRDAIVAEYAAKLRLAGDAS